jgi:hypothetical protein
MTNEFAINGVLCSLPPIYKDIVIGYTMQGESFTFRGLRTQWRTVKVVPIAREIVNPENVYLIYKLKKCFMLNTYGRFCVFDTNSHLLENRTFCIRLA